MASPYTPDHCAASEKASGDDTESWRLVAHPPKDNSKASVAELNGE